MHEGPSTLGGAIFHRYWALFVVFGGSVFYAAGLLAKDSPNLSLLPSLQFNNAYASMLALLLILMIGGGGGFVISLRKDKRQADIDVVDLTQRLRAVAAETVADLRGEVADVRARVDTLERELDRAYVIIRAAVGYAHTLLAYIAFHLPDRSDVPHIPPLLHEYISERAMPFVATGSSSLDSKA